MQKKNRELNLNFNKKAVEFTWNLLQDPLGQGPVKICAPKELSQEA